MTTGIAGFAGSREPLSLSASFVDTVWLATDLQLGRIVLKGLVCGAGKRVRIRTRPACNLIRRSGLLM
jgi:hypothetical protein